MSRVAVSHGANSKVFENLLVLPQKIPLLLLRSDAQSPTLQHEVLAEERTSRPE